MTLRQAADGTDSAHPGDAEDIRIWTTSTADSRSRRSALRAGQQAGPTAQHRSSIADPFRWEDWRNGAPCRGYGRPVLVTAPEGAAYRAAGAHLDLAAGHIVPQCVVDQVRDEPFRQPGISFGRTARRLEAVGLGGRAQRRGPGQGTGGSACRRPHANLVLERCRRPSAAAARIPRLDAGAQLAGWRCRCRVSPPA